MNTIDEKINVCKEILRLVFKQLCGENAIEILDGQREEFQDDKTIKRIPIEKLKDETVYIYFRLKVESAKLWEFFVREVFHDNLLALLTGVKKSETNLITQQIYQSVILYFKLYLKENLFIDLEDMIALSALYYEGNQANGNIYLFLGGNPDFLIEFKNETICIDNNNYRKIRKNLEMTYEDKREKNTLETGLAFVYDGKWKLKGLVQGGNETVRIKFVKHMVWEMYWNNILFIRYNCGGYECPISMENYKSEFERKHNELGGGNDIAELWNCVESAMDQKHGTILIIFYGKEADQEAERLAGGATEKLIVSKKIQCNVIERLMIVDGALLVNEKGIPQGYALILDANEESNKIKLDSGRGSRFNSAKKYIYSLYCKNKSSMAVIVSEDGMVNFYSTVDAGEEKNNEKN